MNNRDIADTIALFLVQEAEHTDIHNGVKSPRASAAWELADRLGVWDQVANITDRAERELAGV